MPTPNLFKRSLQSGQSQIGLWSTLPSPYISELIAGSGFDWLLLDTEHTPTNVPQMVPQLQGVRGMGAACGPPTFGRDGAYMTQAADEICLLVQAETREMLDNLEAMPERAQQCLDLGALFVAVGILLLRAGADALAARFKDGHITPAAHAAMY